MRPPLSYSGVATGFGSLSGVGPAIGLACVVVLVAKLLNPAFLVAGVEFWFNEDKFVAPRLIDLIPIELGTISLFYVD